MAPMGNPFHCRLWLGSNAEIHVKSRKGNLTMIFAAKISRQRTLLYECNNRVVKPEQFCKYEGKQNNFAHSSQCAINLIKYEQKKKCAIYKNTLDIVQKLFWTLSKLMNNTLCKTEKSFVQHRTILCGGSLCNQNSNNTVQNFVQYSAIYKQKLCAIFLILLLCKKACNIL